MATRSVYKTFECVRSDTPQKKFVPPWCSSRYILYISPGKVCGRRTKRFEFNERSDPLREHVHRHTDKLCNGRKENKGGWKGKIIVFAFVIAAGLVASLWMSNKLPRADLITKVIPSNKFVTLLYTNRSTRVNQACHDRIKYLMLEHSKIQYHLKNIMRARTTAFAHNNREDTPKGITYTYIEGVTAEKGSDTEEWRGRLALWGIVPLWRASPPINTILALRKPVPSDCWPFTGSNGEILLYLPRPQKINGISIEHIKPDTARSAPRDIVVYGLLLNDTTVKIMDAQYKSGGSAKQYYQVTSKTAFKSILFRILSNQGNPKYTCVYRFYIYGQH